MISKRIAAVVTVRARRAVQSFGYARHLPMGDPCVVAENLDRWGADEIVINCIDRAGSGPDFDLITRISRMGLSTPLIYGGGIRTAEEGIRAVQLGADRILLDSMLRDDPDAVEAVSEALGAQGVIAALPLTAGVEGLSWRDYRRSVETPFSGDLLGRLLKKRCAEAMVIDWQAEGTPGSFDERLARDFPLPDMPLILFGGLGSQAQTRAMLARDNVVAVAVGNMLSYQEHAVQKLKAGLAGLPVRPPFHASAEGLA